MGGGRKGERKDVGWEGGLGGRGGGNRGRGSDYVKEGESGSGVRGMLRGRERATKRGREGRDEASRGRRGEEGRQQRSE